MTTYYHLGCYPEAIRELATSLEHISQKNKRAEDFLHQVKVSFPAMSNPCDVAPKKLSDKNWWNYYARGKAYAKDDCWLEAAQDFKAAIVQRHKEGYKVKTYGLHFIDEYFPHRELGIAYYHLDCYTVAIRELKISLQHTDKKNERAKEYLSKARDAS